MGGEAAAALSQEGPAATEDFARTELRGLLGARAAEQVTGAVVADWAADPLHLGAYTYAQPGHAGARAALGAPLADGRLVLAGEAVATDGLAGTVGGAFESGTAAARTVLKAIAA